VHTVGCHLRYCLSTSGRCESNLAILDFRQITDFKRRGESIISAININRNLPFALTAIRIFHIFNYKPGIKLITKGSYIILKQETSLIEKKDVTRRENEPLPKYQNMLFQA